MAATHFRKDINGLRAVAVIAVVLFHFGVIGFSGGFVGVDIFFVISGFLMTGIVARGFAKQASRKFSLFDFYIARARRIVPALFFLSLIMLVIGWFYLSPDDYDRLAREVDRSLLFISNNYFYSKSGYFDPDSHERLLLHTWSLSVEWQFYILFPILLLLISKFSVRAIPVSILVFFVISFSYSVIKSHTDPSYAFYMLPSRAWEMFLGGLVYYASTQQRYRINHQLCHYLGCVLVVLAISIYSSATVWPGAAALLPTIGAALIIYAGKDSVFTSNFVFQKLGDWSYSIYLWHWPLAVFILLFDIEQTVLVTTGLITLSVILGALSYYFIENPTRKYLSSKRRLFVFLLMISSIVALLLAAKAVRANSGFIERLPEEIFAVFDQANNKYDELNKCQKKRDKQDCIYGEGGLGVIVIGDSHGMALMGGVVDTFKGHSVLDWTSSGCPTIAGIQSKDKNPSRCNDFLSPRLDRLVDYAGIPIIVVNRFSAHLIGANEDSHRSPSPQLYLEKPYAEFSPAYTKELYQGYVETLCTLAKSNPVYILKPTPELKLNVPNIMGRSLLLNGKEKRLSVGIVEYQERNHVAMRLLDEVASKCNVTVLDPIPYLCDAERCYGDTAGLPIFYDDDHLNLRGSDLLKPLFEKVLLNN